jgi:hypothetical protein
VDVKDVGINAEQHTEGCSSVGDLIVTADEDGGVDALLKGRDGGLEGGE